MEVGCLKGYVRIGAFRQRCTKSVMCVRTMMQEPLKMALKRDTIGGNFVYIKIFGAHNAAHCNQNQHRR